LLIYTLKHIIRLPLALLCYLVAYIQVYFSAASATTRRSGAWQADKSECDSAV